MALEDFFDPAADPNWTFDVSLAVSAFAGGGGNTVVLNYIPVGGDPNVVTYAAVPDEVRSLADSTPAAAFSLPIPFP